MPTPMDATVAGKMSKKARISAALSNGPIDRPPVTLWRHFFDCERSAEDLAGAMLAFHKKYDWDWMKVNPRASYHVEDWGVTTDYGAGGPLDKPVVTKYAVESLEDWGKLKQLPVGEGALGEQLEALERIGESLGGETYFIETIFSPLSIAADLVDNPKTAIPNLMQNHPDVLKGVLDIITATFTDFAGACIKAGASGIFFATTDWASRDLLDEKLYMEWGRPYDLAVLSAVQGAPFNVLHVCKNNNLLFSLADYPVHAINWAVGSPGNPGLREVQLNTSKTVIGGWKNETLRDGTPAMVKAEARVAREQTGGRRFMFGPACSIAPDSPEENVKAARAVADVMSSM